MGPPSYMPSLFDRNVFMPRIPVYVNVMCVCVCIYIYIHTHTHTIPLHIYIYVSNCVTSSQQRDSYGCHQVTLYMSPGDNHCMSPGDTLYMSPDDSHSRLAVGLMWHSSTVMSLFAVDSCITAGCSCCQLTVGTDRRAAVIIYWGVWERERERETVNCVAVLQQAA